MMFIGMIIGGSMAFIILILGWAVLYDTDSIIENIKKIKKEI